MPHAMSFDMLIYRRSSRERLKGSGVPGSASEPAHALVRYSSAMEEPDHNTGREWSRMDLSDLRHSVEA
jgi:hypothetical protein